MPELPEVEVLVRHLAPTLAGRRIRGVEVRRARVIRPGSVSALRRTLVGARFTGVSRRGKYLLFTLERPGSRVELTLLGHLGMTGRLYLNACRDVLPRHAAVVMDLGGRRLVFEDARYFGRLSLDMSALERLGPEPFSRGFNPKSFGQALARSRQAIKVRLLDQGLVAGVGNIYASEALFRARIAPQTRADQLDQPQVVRLWRAIRRTLREAVRFGSTVPLDWRGEGETAKGREGERAKGRDGERAKGGTGEGKRLFYYGRSPVAREDYTERLAVYGRAGQPCWRCRSAIRRIVQGGRSTFYCPHCQSAAP